MNLICLSRVELVAAHASVPSTEVCLGILLLWSILDHSLPTAVSIALKWGKCKPLTHECTEKCTDPEMNVCTWLRGVFSCSCITVLPGIARVLLSKMYQLFISSLCRYRVNREVCFQGSMLLRSLKTYVFLMFPYRHIMCLHLYLMEPQIASAILAKIGRPICSRLIGPFLCILYAVNISHCEFKLVIVVFK